MLESEEGNENTLSMLESEEGNGHTSAIGARKKSEQASSHLHVALQ